MFGQKYKPKANNADYDNPEYNRTDYNREQQYECRTLPGQGRDRRYQHIQESLHAGTSVSSLDSSSPMESTATGYKSKLLHYSGEDISSKTGAATNWPPLLRSYAKGKSTSMTNVLQDQPYEHRQRGSTRNRSLDRSVVRKRSEGQINYRNISIEHESAYNPFDPKQTEYQSAFYQSVQDRDKALGKNLFVSSHTAFDSNLDQDNMLDMQAQVAELNKECANLQQELDIVKDKLSSSMNSIKNFWSPELKKERAYRREETAKLVQVNDHLKATQHEKQEALVALKSAKENMVIAGEHYQSDFNGLEKEKQASEILILQKTIEEMDKRILTQKRTLQSRDDSITRLLDMLKSKSDPSSGDLNQQLQNLEALLVHKKAGAQADLAQLKLVESLKSQLLEKDTELSSLQTKMDTMQMKCSEQEHCIYDLTENKKTKEEHVSLLNQNVENLKSKQKEKETEINVMKARITVMEEKGSEQNSHVQNLQEITQKNKTLQEKISQLNKQLEDLRNIQKVKDTEINVMKARVAVMEVKGSEESENIKNLQETEEKNQELQEKILELNKQIQDCKGQLLDKETVIAELKSNNKSLELQASDQNHHVNVLTEKIKVKDRELSDSQHNKNEVQESITEKETEINSLKKKIKSMEAEFDEHVHHIDLQQMKIDGEQKKITQLQEINKDLKSSIKEKDSEMHSLQKITETLEKQTAEQIKTIQHYQEKIAEKHDKTKQETSLTKEKQNRIEELEEALRESVKITAQREIAMAEQLLHLEQTHKHMEEFNERIDKLREDKEESEDKIEDLTIQLSEKERELNKLLAEREKQLEEVYKMKEEAVLAAISEKDANIALLELAATKKLKHKDQREKLGKEKEVLQKQLRELHQKILLKQPDSEKYNGEKNLESTD